MLKISSHRASRSRSQVALLSSVCDPTTLLSWHPVPSDLSHSIGSV